MMKILMVHDVLGSQGGAESTLRHLALSLKLEGAELSLLFGKETSQDMAVSSAPYEKVFTTETEGVNTALKHALAWHPDVIFVHKFADVDELEALVDAADSHGVPLVRMVHDHDIYCQRRHRYHLFNRQICKRKTGLMCGALCGVVRNRQSKLGLALADPRRKLREIKLHHRFYQLLTVSDYLQDELELNGLSTDKMTTIYPPTVSPPLNYKATYAEPLAIFSGQILRGKGLDVLIEALTFVDVPGFRAVILGDGTYRPYCEHLVRKRRLEDRVKFAGFVKQDELHSYFARARVGVVPSLWPEPFGASGLEMMRFGLPILGFEVGGVPEWLADQSGGYLLDPFDVEGMGRRLNQLMSSPESAREMGEKAKTHAAVFPERSEFVASVMSVLKDACAHRGVSTGLSEVVHGGALSVLRPANENQVDEITGSVVKPGAGATKSPAYAGEKGLR